MQNQNVPQLVLTNSNASGHQTVPRLITNIASLQPQHTTGQVQIRPVITGVPQGGGQLTLIQRPGQQAQLVQQIMQPQTMQKIITRPQVVQVQQTPNQQITTQAANAGTTIKVAAATGNATGQRRGLSLSVILQFIYSLKIVNHEFFFASVKTCCRR